MESGLTLAPMGKAAIDPAYERALAAEIAASELLRMRVVAVTLTILLAADQALFLFARPAIEQFLQKPVPTWLPSRVIGFFLVYEVAATLFLRHRLARGKAFPRPARYFNAFVETSLPTVILLAINHLAGSQVAFGAWPVLLYFIFIIASTLRLGFMLSEIGRAHV